MSVVVSAVAGTIGRVIRGYLLGRVVTPALGTINRIVSRREDNVEIPVHKIYLFPWQATVFCFDFSDEGVMQQPTPPTLTVPEVGTVDGGVGPEVPVIGVPEIIDQDFYNSKGYTPQKVSAGKGVSVEFAAGQGTTVPGNYPMRCTVTAGSETLTRSVILVVSENPEE